MPFVRQSHRGLRSGRARPATFLRYLGLRFAACVEFAVRAPARRLDRCINDICRLEAITGSPTTSGLVQRLLDMPAAAGVYPTLNLVGLSTAARIRCMERLAEQPVNWLTTEDDFVVAHRRRLILAAGGHAPLIAYIVKKLERRRSATSRRAGLQRLRSVQPFWAPTYASGRQLIHHPVETAVLSAIDEVLIPMPAVRRTWVTSSQGTRPPCSSTVRNNRSRLAPTSQLSVCPCHRPGLISP